MNTIKCTEGVTIGADPCGHGKFRAYRESDGERRLVCLRCNTLVPDWTSGTIEIVLGDSSDHTEMRDVLHGVLQPKSGACTACDSEQFVQHREGGDIFCALSNCGVRYLGDTSAIEGRIQFPYKVAAWLKQRENVLCALPAPQEVEVLRDEIVKCLSPDCESYRWVQVEEHGPICCRGCGVVYTEDVPPPRIFRQWLDDEVRAQTTRAKSVEDPKFIVGRRIPTRPGFKVATRPTDQFAPEKGFDPSANTQLMRADDIKFGECEQERTPKPFSSLEDGDPVSTIPFGTVEAPSADDLDPETRKRLGIDSQPEEVPGDLEIDRLVIEVIPHKHPDDNDEDEDTFDRVGAEDTTQDTAPVPQVGDSEPISKNKAIEVSPLLEQPSDKEPSQPSEVSPLLAGLLNEAREEVMREKASLEQQIRDAEGQRAAKDVQCQNREARKRHERERRKEADATRAQPDAETAEEQRIQEDIAKAVGNGDLPVEDVFSSAGGYMGGQVPVYSAPVTDIVSSPRPLGIQQSGDTELTSRVRHADRAVERVSFTDRSRLPKRTLTALAAVAILLLVIGGLVIYSAVSPPTSRAEAVDTTMEYSNLEQCVDRNTKDSGLGNGEVAIAMRESIEAACRKTARLGK